MGLVQTPRQKTVCSRGEARPALSRTRSPSSGPLQSRHPGVTAERVRARRGRATFRLCDDGTRRPRDAGELGVGCGGTQGPHSTELTPDVAALGVTAVTTRGWRAAGQVSTGRSMWLRVPAARLCPHLQCPCGSTVPQPAAGEAARSRRHPEEPAAGSFTDSALCCCSLRSRASRSWAAFSWEDGAQAAEGSPFQGSREDRLHARVLTVHLPTPQAPSSLTDSSQGGARLRPFTK